MPVINIPSQGVKRGEASILTLNKSALFALPVVVSDSWFSDQMNINYCIAEFRAAGSTQKKRVAFSISASVPSARLYISAKAKDSWALNRLILVDYDADTFTVLRDQVTLADANDFTLDAEPQTPYPDEPVIVPVLFNDSSDPVFLGLPLVEGSHIAALNTAENFNGLDYSFDGDPFAARLGRPLSLAALNVSLLTPEMAVSGPFQVSALFSQSVSGFTLSDVSVSSGYAASFTGASDQYGFMVSPSAFGTVSVSVPVNSVTGATGGNFPSNVLAVEYLSNHDVFDGMPNYQVAPNLAALSESDLVFDGSPLKF